MKKIWIGLTIVVVLAGGVVAGVYYKKAQTNNTTAEETTNPNIIEITANKGQTALDALKSKANVDYSDSADGALVNAVNGIKNDDKNFWLYSVNGTAGMVAADKYICKSDDLVKWEYKSF